MQSGEETGKGKKVRYSVLVVSEGTKGTDRHFSTSLGVFVVFLAAAAILTIAALSYCFVLAGELSRANDQAALLETRVAELVRQNEDLLAQKVEVAKENEELQKKVEIFSDTINGKVQQEKEREAMIAQAHLPTGFPLRGTASYKAEETELEGNPIAVFHASQDACILYVCLCTI